MQPRVPEVIGERCVHARLQQATCRACVEVCPRGAWVFDEEQLGIDTELCDGCDLCAPACPQGAIRPHFLPAVKESGKSLLAFAICERAGIAGLAEGLMPCLHSMGMTALLQLWNQGVRELVVARADCAACDRASSADLEQVLGKLHRLLSARDALPLRCRELEPSAWRQALQRACQSVRDRPLDRRAFFRTALRDPRERLRAAVGEPEPEFQAPGQLLPPAGPKDLHPFVPVIDPARCNGCDACVRLCPTQSLSLTEDSRWYRVHAVRCTGCGVCTDVCEEGAVEVRTLETCEQDRIELHNGRCPTCGVDFHVPELSAGPLCRICRQVNHSGKLFQVLE